MNIYILGKKKCFSVADCLECAGGRERERRGGGVVCPPMRPLNAPFLGGERVYGVRADWGGRV